MSEKVLNAQNNNTEKKSLVTTIVDGVSGIFLPLVHLLTAAGILKGILAILTMTALVPGDSETYLVLNAMADAVFYFLPVMLAATAAKKFGANPFTCMVIACALLYPSLTEVMEAGNSVQFFGLTLKGVTYKSGVIPIIMAAGLLTFVERFLKKILPELLEGFLTPLLCILIVGFVTLFVFGPLGAVIGDALAAGYGYVYEFSPVAAGALLGAFMQPMVIFGFHWSFFLIAMNNVALTGQDTILALMAPAVFAQAGAALAVMVKSKDKNLRSLCVSASMSVLMGITEPAMFGVNLPRKKPMLAVCIGGGIGGAIAGISGAHAMAFVFPSIVTFPVFLGDGFVLYLVSCIAGTAAAFLFTLLSKFEVDIER